MARTGGKVSTASMGSKAIAKMASTSNDPQPSKLFKSKKFIDREAKRIYEEDQEQQFIPERGINVGMKYDYRVNNVIRPRNWQKLSSDNTRERIKNCCEICQEFYANGHRTRKDQSVQVMGVLYHMIGHYK
ncbi:hypothetical protein Scep_027777 [Stephania cephalantha]|uniref:Uncharacterized protein n=1 Tax=Stephania cephalantha TaxID=152367 RepID=A0AAP0HMV1_9MAGN